MQYKIINLTEAVQTSWDGGMTYQLFIYPENGSYKERTFDFRISVATALLEDSQYTQLPNITRHLMMLEGEAQVFHAGQESVFMTPYKQIDVFDGGVESSAQGKVTDFNLMLANGWQGELTVEDKSQIITLPAIPFLVFYCHKGKVQFSLENQTQFLYDGDMLILRDIPLGKTIALHLQEDCKLIRADILRANSK